MEGQAWTSTILINVLVQIVNLAIFFFAFKYFLWDTITAALEERQRLMKKLKNAEHEYNKIIEDAHKEWEVILSATLEKQKHLVKEHDLLLLKSKKDILDAANKKAEDISKNAELQGQKIKKELEDNREESVKHASKIVVKKLITENTELKNEYLTSLIKEIKK